LSKADEVYLLPIYPARELPMEGVRTEMIAERMQHASVQLLSKEQWLETCKHWRDTQQVPAMLVTAGAGDIDALVPLTQSILYTA
jgi:UDP-N-acetylmuramate--alanine ligase